MKKNNLLKGMGALMALLSVHANAVNTVTKVATVNDGVAVTQEVDYTITSKTPFGAAGSVDLQNPQAVVIFQNVIPSELKANFLANIFVNGEQAVVGTNVRVAVYNQGSIVLPYAKGGITLYADADAKGESVSYNATTRTALSGTMNNNAESFVLKRGYMACLFTGGDASGYNRVWVADKEDITVNLPAELKNKVSAIRVYEWRWSSKKGYAGNDDTFNPRLNTTWFYGWDAGNWSREDREYIPQHHHEGWPSISEVTGHSDCTAILGNNEPDNKADNREQDIDYIKVLANWPEMMKGGQRLVSPAMSSNYNGWLYPFMDSIDARGWRCDAVAVHAYWNSNPTNFMNSLKAIYNRTKRPLWITEFNYGANWTGETWPDADRSASAANCERMRAWIAELIPLLDAAPYVERYSIYNWVQDCRSVYLNGNSNFASTDYLTPAGVAYAKTNTSQMSYQPENIAPIVPRYRHLMPSIPSLVYTRTSGKVVLTLKNNDGEQSDTVFIERNFDNGEYVAIDTLTGIATEKVQMEYTTSLKDMPSGLYNYRLRAIGSDGRTRISDVQSASVTGIRGEGNFQYGDVDVPNISEVQTSFAALENDEKPAVFMGASTQNDANFAAIPHVKTIQKNYFGFRFLPWNDNTSLEQPENIGFIVAKKGNFVFDGKNVEIATVKDPSTGNDLKVKKAEVEVKFNVPFAEGVTPIVIPQEFSSLLTGPFIPKVTNVTNTGFTLHMACSEACTSADAALHYVNYIAVEPGQTVMDNKVTLTAGTLSSVGSTVGKALAFNDEFNQPYELPDTLLFAATQTDNSGIANYVRYKKVGSTYRVYRPLDPATSSKNVSSKYYDTVGWMVVSSKSSVNGVNSVAADKALEVKVVNGYVVVNQYDDYSIYSTSGQMMSKEKPLVPGVYLVKCGKHSAKVVVK